MADKKHVHGEMNMDAQEKAFDGFISMVGKGAVVVLVALVLLYLING